MSKKKTYNIEIDSYIGYPISRQYVYDRLKACGDGPVSVRINSLGGDLNTALYIRQLFADHGDVTVEFQGFCASAATILAMGAKQVNMSRHALLLVHQCSSYSETYGFYNRDELEEAIVKLKKNQADLDTIDRVVASVYAAKAGGSPQKMAALMAESRWINAEEALKLGLIDAIDDDDDVADDDPSKAISASVRAHFVACGLPLPNQNSMRSVSTMATVHESASWINTLAKTLRDIFQPTPAVTAQQQNNKTIMNKNTIIESELVCAILGAEHFEATADGKVWLSSEQIATLENGIKNLIDKKEQAIADKKAAEKKLAEADGATTDSATPTHEEEQHTIAGVESANFYNKFGNLL